MRFLPGDTISYSVSYLEMEEGPDFDWPKEPTGDILILRAKNPPARYFLSLYEAVGKDYEWTDKLICPCHEVDEFLSDSDVELFTFIKDGWTAGFYMLDKRKKGVCDLAYFGLLPEAIGSGYGEYLLETAVKMGWESRGIKKLTVNTNSLDHPNALPLYRKIGFNVIRIAQETRVLSRPRSVINK